MTKGEGTLLCELKIDLFYESVRGQLPLTWVCQKWLFTNQVEVDYDWSARTANGGQESNCGWCKDTYGLLCQVVPFKYFELINSDDPKVRDKAIKNTLTQKKLVLSALKKD